MGIFDWLKIKKQKWDQERKRKEWKRKEEERKNKGTYGVKSTRDEKKRKGEKDKETFIFNKHYTKHK